MMLKIGILGTRGIPNHYGGFEHFAEHLSKGLTQKGHQVTVYNSSKHPYRQKEWNGVRIVHCFDPEYIIGVPGQFVYDLNCILHARKEKYDVLLMLGYTSSSVWGFLYPGKTTVVITNMDGLEWQRTKFSKPARRFLKFAEKLAVKWSHYHIADSPVIKQYLDSTYHINSKYIAYGASPEAVANEKILQEYGLIKNNYFLLMARMEPENNIEMILDGYCLTNAATPFMVIGNNGNGYGSYLVNKYKKDKRILFAGGIFDNEKVHSLTAFCSLYFHGHSVGGTNPSLLDAMASGAPLAAHRNPFNFSILKENALAFSNAGEVCNIINSGYYANTLHIQNNYTSIKDEFTWNAIIRQYESFFMECLPAAKYYPIPQQNVFFIEDSIEKKIS